MPTKNIIVTQRFDYLSDRDEWRDSVDFRLCEWILRSGYTPFPIPNCIQSDSEAKEWIDQLDPCGLILSGGGSVLLQDHRSKLEAVLLDSFEAQRLPVLGICRGMQALATRAGIGLVAVEGHVNVHHHLVSSMADLSAFPAAVNSYHELCIQMVPPDYIVSALSSDGSIEAIKRNSLPWEGWMWHPERNSEFNLIDTTRLQQLFGSSS